MTARTSVGASLAALVLLPACAHAQRPAAAPRPQPRVAAGRATDAVGRPLAGVTVDVWGTASANGGIVNYSPKTDPSGSYRQADMVPGTYTVRAWLPIRYNGQVYATPLAPTRGEPAQEFQSKAGIVRDFVLRVSGPRPGMVDPDDPASYYGASLTINGTDALAKYLELPDGTTVRGTLTPDGPLLDGSAGRPITFAFPFKRTQYLHTVKDIPVGRYTLSLTAVAPDGSSKPVRLHQGSGGYDDANYRPTVTVEFPAQGVANPRPYQGKYARDAAVNTRL